MKLPNCEQAEVTRRKLTTYLLDGAHPQNKGKAAFYELVGYNQLNTDALKEALLGLILESEIMKQSMVNDMLWKAGYRVRMGNHTHYEQSGSSIMAKQSLN